MFRHNPGESHIILQNLGKACKKYDLLPPFRGWSQFRYEYDGPFDELERRVHGGSGFFPYSAIVRAYLQEGSQELGWGEGEERLRNGSGMILDGF